MYYYDPYAFNPRQTPKIKVQPFIGPGTLQEQPFPDLSLVLA